MQNGSILESDLIHIDFITHPPCLREWLLKLGGFQSDTVLQPDAAIFPYAYRFGSCDIFPLWFISATVSYLKESGDYGILEDIRLQNVFNSFCTLSGEFAGMIGKYAECGQISVEDTVTAGLFECVCTEYLGLCRFMDMTREASSAAVRLKWISDFSTRLSGQFGEVEWQPYIIELLGKRTSSRRIRGHINFRREISQFILSGIFEIIRIHNKKNAQKYWLTTSSEWSSKSTTELIFGIKPGFHGLFVNPCIPDNFGNYKIIRTFRNAVYDISVINPGHTTSDIRKLVVDNSEYLGNLLPNFADGKTHRVEVTMGSFD